MGKEDTVASYIARVFPCDGTCDSHGRCENCTEAILIHVGADIKGREMAAKVEHYEKALKEIVSVGYTGAEYVARKALENK